MGQTGGRDTKKDDKSDVGLNQAGLIERAKTNFKKNRQITLEILISEDRFVNIKVSTAFCQALGISSETELATQIIALGVGDEIKRYIAPVKRRGNNEDAGRASSKNVPSTSLREKLIGTQYQVLLHTPIKYSYGGVANAREGAWYTIRTPGVVSIAAFSLFLARFATANKMPAGLTTKTESRLYIPTNSTEGLTKVDKVNEA